MSTSRIVTWATGKGLALLPRNVVEVSYGGATSPTMRLVVIRKPGDEVLTLFNPRTTATIRMFNSGTTVMDLNEQFKYGKIVAWYPTLGSSVREEGRVNIARYVGEEVISNGFNS